MLWCNTHSRPAYLCKVRGGILIPCKSIDLKDKLEIEYYDKETNEYLTDDNLTIMQRWTNKVVG